MAFNVNIPGPKIVDLDLFGKLSSIGTSLRENADEATVRSALADLRSDDPASMDAFLQKVGHLPKYAEFAQKLMQNRQQALDRAATRDIARGQLGVAQGRLGVSQEQLKVIQDKARRQQEIMKDLFSGTEGSPAATAPVPPAVVPAPDDDTGPDDADDAVDLSSANRVVSADAPVAPATQEPSAIDLSSAQKVTPAAPAQSPINRFLALTPDQLLKLIASTDDPALRQAAAMRRRELMTTAKKEKDPRMEGFEKKEGEATSKMVGELREKSAIAREQQGLLQTQEEELRKYPTGTIAKWMYPINKFISSAANEMGKGISGPEGTGLGQLIDVARERARGVEVLEGTTSDLLFRKLQGFGKGITNDERGVMRQIYAGIEKTTEGNLALTRMQMHANEIAIRERQRIDQYLQYRKSIGKAPLPEHIEKLRDAVQEQGMQELKARAEADRKRFGLERIHWPKKEGAEQQPRGAGESY